jgi:hypothetical protein
MPHFNLMDKLKITYKDLKKVLPMGSQLLDKD